MVFLKSRSRANLTTLISENTLTAHKCLTLKKFKAKVKIGPVCD